MAKSERIIVDIVLEREVYYANRKTRLEEFKACLSEPKNRFAVAAAIRAIIEQERFVAHIGKNGHKVAKAKEEERFLASMVEEAKKVFGKDYDSLRKESY
jgi:hypothetical protein